MALMGQFAGKRVVVRRPEVPMQMGIDVRAHRALLAAGVWLVVLLSTVGVARGAWLQIHAHGLRRVVLVDPHRRRAGTCDTAGIAIPNSRYWVGAFPGEARGDGPVTNFLIDNPVDGRYVLSAVAGGGLVQVDYVGEHDQLTAYNVDVMETKQGDALAWTLGWKVDGPNKPPVLRLERQSRPRKGSEPSSIALGSGRVLVVVDGGVSALLVDKRGRRTGWADGQARREIIGCRYAADDVGQDDEDAHEARVEAPDSSRTESVRAPDVHEFEFYDGKVKGELFADGACELRVIAPRGLVADVGIRGVRGADMNCYDHREDTLQAGVLYRYRLKWSIGGDSCIVRIADRKAATLERHR